MQKIAISNGSINGSSQIKVDGTRAYSTDLIFSYFNVTGIAATSFSGWVYADPDTSVRPIIAAGNTPATVAISDFASPIGYLWGLTGVDSFRPYDVSPGSYSEFAQDAAYGVAAYADSSTVNFVNTTFIPTISAFDINTDNFYFDFQSYWPVEGTISPFDKCYALGSYFYGGNGDANYIDFPDLISSTDILSQIGNSDSYSECEGVDYIISATNIPAGSSQNWKVSQYLTANDLVVDSGASASLTAGEAVIITPGTIFENGSNVTLEIKPCTYNVCTPPAEKKGKINNSDLYPPRNTSLTPHIEVYPNPSTSILNVKLPSNPDNDAEIIVYSDEGVQVKKHPIQQIKFQLGVADLPAGLYLLIYKSKNTYVTEKFTVIKL